MTAICIEQQRKLDSYHATILQIVNAKHDQVAESFEYSSWATSFDSSALNRRKKSRKPFGARQSSSLECTCNSQVTHWNADPGDHWAFRLRFPALSLSKTAQTSIIHDRKCPLWFTSNTDTTYKIRSRAFNWGLIASVKVSKSLCDILLGCNISASLQMIPIVSHRSPTARVIQKYVYLDMDSQTYSKFIRDLLVVFKSRQGSPWDSMVHGQKFLGVSGFFFLH